MLACLLVVAVGSGFAQADEIDQRGNLIRWYCEFREPFDVVQQLQNEETLLGAVVGFVAAGYKRTSALVIVWSFTSGNSGT